MNCKHIDLIVILIIVFIFSVQGCDRREDLTMLSPKEVMTLYFESRENGNKETLRKIIYFPDSISESEINNSIESILAGADEKSMMKMVGGTPCPEDERIIDNDMAEVGIVLRIGPVGISKRIPYQQVVMKKEQGIWKRHYSKYELTEDQLIAAIRKNPQDASAYYLLGRKYQPNNAARSNRYFKKYYELEPNGFWVSEEFLSTLKNAGDIKKREKQALKEVQMIPQKSGGRSMIYVSLGQLFTEYGDYEKAEMYLDKAKEEFARDHVPEPIIEKYKKTEENLQLRKEGKYHDILDELEASKDK